VKLQTLAAACAAFSTLAVSTAAFAADPVIAKLAAPVSEKTKVIAGGSMFFCEADACVAAVPTSQTMNLATCMAIAGKVGQLVSSGGRKALEADRLADCNATAVAKAKSSTELAKQ
jgi:hypothetical protein